MVKFKIISIADDVSKFPSPILCELLLFLPVAIFTDQLFERSFFKVEGSNGVFRMPFGSAYLCDIAFP